MAHVGGRVERQPTEWVEKGVLTTTRIAISRCVVCSKHHEHQPLRSNLAANQEKAVTLTHSAITLPMNSAVRGGPYRFLFTALPHCTIILLQNAHSMSSMSGWHLH
jgi:hypothetical protein